MHQLQKNKPLQYTQHLSLDQDHQLLRKKNKTIITELSGQDRSVTTKLDNLQERYSFQDKYAEIYADLREKQRLERVQRQKQQLSVLNEKFINIFSNFDTFNKKSILKQTQSTNKPQKQHIKNPKQLQKTESHPEPQQSSAIHFATQPSLVSLCQQYRLQISTLQSRIRQLQSTVQLLQHRHQIANISAPLGMQAEKDRDKDRSGEWMDAIGKMQKEYEEWKAGFYAKYKGEVKFMYQCVQYLYACYQQFVHHGLYKQVLGNIPKIGSMNILKSLSKYHSTNPTTSKLSLQQFLVILPKPSASSTATPAPPVSSPFFVHNRPSPHLNQHQSAILRKVVHQLYGFVEILINQYRRELDTMRGSIGGNWNNVVQQVQRIVGQFVGKDSRSSIGRNQIQRKPFNNQILQKSITKQTPNNKPSQKQKQKQKRKAPCLHISSQLPPTIPKQSSQSFPSQFQSRNKYSKATSAAMPGKNTTGISTSIVTPLQRMGEEEYLSRIQDKISVQLGNNATKLKCKQYYKQLTPNNKCASKSKHK